MKNAGKYGFWGVALFGVACGGGQSFDDGRDGLSLQGNVRQTPAAGIVEGDDDGSSVIDDAQNPSQQAAELTSECAEADAQHRAPYENWLAQANDFRELTGRTFAGYVEGGSDVSLVLDESGNGKLIVGEPAPPPNGDDGYLCDEADQDHLICTSNYSAFLIEGGTYPLHGAAFADERLVAPIQPKSPFDAWCALQTPYAAENCYFYSFPGDATSARGASEDPPSDSSCSVGSALVDCGWFELSMENNPCFCTSTECFLYLDEAPPSIDVRYDAETGELAGSVVDGARMAQIHLFEVEDPPQVSNRQ